MEKITSQKFSKKLASYGAMSMAIAGLTDASGQIVYTDVDPDFAGGVTIDYGLDLNNDGTVDFNIDAGTINSGAYFAVQMDDNGISGNSFLGSIPYYTYPFALDSGAPVSSGQASWQANGGTLNFASCYLGGGTSNWCGVTDKYLGLRFQVAGNTHYGWARLDVSASGNSFTLKEYAYNTTPDAAITAGQTLSVENNQLSRIKITALNKSIALFNLPETTEYNLFSISGKSILEGKLIGNTHVIEANSISTGVYILELKDSSSNNVIRQKIVL